MTDLQTVVGMVQLRFNFKSKNVFIVVISHFSIVPIARDCSPNLLYKRPSDKWVAKFMKRKVLSVQVKTGKKHRPTVELLPRTKKSSGSPFTKWHTWTPEFVLEI